MDLGWIFNLPAELKSAALELWNLISKYLAVPIDFNRLGVVQYLYGNTWTLAAQVAFYVFVGVFAVSLLVKRWRLNGALSLMQVFLIPTIAALWFVVAQQLQNLGDLLKQIVSSFGIDTLPTGVTSSIDLVPSLPSGETIIDILTFGLLAQGAYTVYTLLLMYAFMNVILTVLGLLVFAMYGLSEGTRKFFSLIVSVFMVTAVTGIPVILLLTKIAELISNILPNGGANAAVTIILICIAINVGLFLQIVLVYVGYKQVNRVIVRHIEQNKPLRSVLENKRRLEANLAGRQNSTVSHKFQQIRAGAVNTGIGVADEMKRHYGVQAAGALREFAKPSKAQVASMAATTVAKAAPHPLVKVGAVALAAGINVVANKSLPRVKGSETNE
jgi:hypothetical protein